MAHELQTRAREYLAKIEAEYDDRRKALGVEDDVKDVPGVTTAMLVKFGENDIKSVEDLAGSVTDDLVGWRKRHVSFAGRADRPHHCHFERRGGLWRRHRI